MPCFRLRSYDNAPRGGYFFEEYGPKPRQFTASPMIENLAKQVWGYRKGNGLPRASYHEAMEDVDRYQCRRTGNDPNFCIPCGENKAELSADPPGVNGQCASCGAVIKT